MILHFKNAAENEPKRETGPRYFPCGRAVGRIEISAEDFDKYGPDAIIEYLQEVVFTRFLPERFTSDAKQNDK